MDKILSMLLGALCGIGQFFVMRYTLKPLEKGESLQVGLLILLRLPIPLLLLVGCAWFDITLLAFAGGTFCLGLITAAVLNHLITLKKKG